MRQLPSMPPELRRLVTRNKVILNKETGETAMLRELKAMDASELDDLFYRSVKGLMEYRNRAEMVDFVGRGRVTVAAGNAGVTLTRLAAVKATLLRVLGPTLKGGVMLWSFNSSLNAALEAYARGDALGFQREVALATADVVASDVVLPAVLGEAGKDLAASGLIAAADLVFFQPLNQRVLADYYNTTKSEHGVFT